MGADFLRRFRPCVVNYLVQFRRSLPSGPYFITPHPNYSSQWWNPPPYGLDPEENLPDGFWCIGTETDCDLKLDRDLALIASAGFNTLRIVGIGPIVDATAQTLTCQIAPPSTASLNDYLGLLTKLLSKVASHGLRAILLVGANGPNTAQWQLPNAYRSFLIDVCTHIGGHPGLLAYDLYNEPAWCYPWSSNINKLITSHWIADSYWAIKSISPNTLVTIGLTHPHDIGGWDPALTPVDFISYHFYPKDVTFDKMASMFYWAKQTSLRPWIIGETGLAGNDNPWDPVVTQPIPSEGDQKLFADTTIQQSLDYGCYGYSWWQYQECCWNSPDNYMGLLTRLDPQNPATTEQKKPAFYSFASYAGGLPQPQNAVKPAIYYNPDSHPMVIRTGKVVDTDGNAVSDASIRLRCPQGQTWVFYSSLSAPDGTFSVSVPASTALPDLAEVTSPGYAVAYPNAASSVMQVVLEAWRDDTWSRRWIASAPGELNVFSASSDWVIDPTDAFYVGDFNGDGAEELLCVQTLGSAGDSMIMLRFDGNWALEWTNEKDPARGGGIYPYRQRMVVGDFDGDGADEVLGIGAQGDWLTLFKYQNGDWLWISSTGGNQQHALTPYANNLHAGNFNGSGGELLLGIDVWTTLFRFDAGKNDWEWVDSDYGKTNDPAHPLSAFRPYVSEFRIGDFDGDGKDEVLGIPGNGAGSWVTLFGIRAAGSLQWLISNSGNDAAVLSGIAPYRNKAVVGRFDGPARDRVLGLAGHSAMFGFEGRDFQDSGDFQRMWDSDRMKFAGLNVTATDKVLAFRPLRTMPDYLLVIPDPTRKASLIAFDPILRS